MGAIDVIFVPLVICATAITILIGASLLTSTDDVVEDIGMNNTYYQNYSNSFYNMLVGISNLTPFIIVLLLIVVGLMAFRLRTHPAFIPLLAVSSILLLTFANLTQDIFFRTQTATAPYINMGDFGMLEVGMLNIVIISLIALGVIMIVMFIAPPRADLL